MADNQSVQVEFVRSLQADLLEHLAHYLTLTYSNAEKEKESKEEKTWQRFPRKCNFYIDAIVRIGEVSKSQLRPAVRLLCAFLPGLTDWTPVRFDEIVQNSCKDYVQIFGFETFRSELQKNMQQQTFEHRKTQDVLLCVTELAVADTLAHVCSFYDGDNLDAKSISMLVHIALRSCAPFQPQGLGEGIWSQLRRAAATQWAVVLHHLSRCRLRDVLTQVWSFVEAVGKADRFELLAEALRMTQYVELRHDVGWASNIICRYASMLDEYKHDGVRVALLRTLTCHISQLNLTSDQTLISSVDQLYSKAKKWSKESGKSNAELKMSALELMTCIAVRHTDSFFSQNGRSLLQERILPMFKKDYKQLPAAVCCLRALRGGEGFGSMWPSGSSQPLAGPWVPPPCAQPPFLGHCGPRPSEDVSNWVGRMDSILNVVLSKESFPISKENFAVTGDAYVNILCEAARHDLRRVADRVLASSPLSGSRPEVNIEKPASLHAALVVLRFLRTIMRHQEKLVEFARSGRFCNDTVDVLSEQFNQLVRSQVAGTLQLIRDCEAALDLTVSPPSDVPLTMPRSTGVWSLNGPVGDYYLISLANSRADSSLKKSKGKVDRHLIHVVLFNALRFLSVAPDALTLPAVPESPKDLMDATRGGTGSMLVSEDVGVAAAARSTIAWRVELATCAEEQGPPICQALFGAAALLHSGHPAWAASLANTIAHLVCRAADSLRNGKTKPANRQLLDTCPLASWTEAVALLLLCEPSPHPRAAALQLALAAHEYRLALMQCLAVYHSRRPSLYSLIERRSAWIVSTVTGRPVEEFDPLPSLWDIALRDDQEDANPGPGPHPAGGSHVRWGWKWVGYTARACFSPRIEEEQDTHDAHDTPGRSDAGDAGAHGGKGDNGEKDMQVVWSVADDMRQITHALASLHSRKLYSLLTVGSAKAPPPPSHIDRWSCLHVLMFASVVVPSVASPDAGEHVVMQYMKFEELKTLSALPPAMQVAFQGALSVSADSCVKLVSESILRWVSDFFDSGKVKKKEKLAEPVVWVSSLLRVIVDHPAFARVLSRSPDLLSACVSFLQKIASRFEGSQGWRSAQGGAEKDFCSISLSPTDLTVYSMVALLLQHIGRACYEERFHFASRTGLSRFHPAVTYEPTPAAAHWAPKERADSMVWLLFWAQASPGAVKAIEEAVKKMPKGKTVEMRSLQRLSRQCRLAFVEVMRATGASSLPSAADPSASTCAEYSARFLEVLADESRHGRTALPAVLYHSPHEALHPFITSSFSDSHMQDVLFHALCYVLVPHPVAVGTDVLASQARAAKEWMRAGDKQSSSSSPHCLTFAASIRAEAPRLLVLALCHLDWAVRGDALNAFDLICVLAPGMLEDEEEAIRLEEVLCEFRSRFLVADVTLQRTVRKQVYRAVATSLTLLAKSIIEKAVSVDIRSCSALQTRALIHVVAEFARTLTITPGPEFDGRPTSLNTGARASEGSIPLVGNAVLPKLLLDFSEQLWHVSNGFLHEEEVKDMWAALAAKPDASADFHSDFDFDEDTLGCSVSYVLDIAADRAFRHHMRESNDKQGLPDGSAVLLCQTIITGLYGRYPEGVGALLVSPLTLKGARELTCDWGRVAGGVCLMLVDLASGPLHSLTHRLPDLLTFALPFYGSEIDYGLHEFLIKTLVPCARWSSGWEARACDGRTYAALCDGSLEILWGQEDAVFVNDLRSSFFAETPAVQMLIPTTNHAFRPPPTVDERGRYLRDVLSALWPSIIAAGADVEPSEKTRVIRDWGLTVLQWAHGCNDLEVSMKMLETFRGILACIDDDDDLATALVNDRTIYLLLACLHRTMKTAVVEVAGGESLYRIDQAAKRTSRRASLFDDATDHDRRASLLSALTSTRRRSLLEPTEEESTTGAPCPPPQAPASMTTDRAWSLRTGKSKLVLSQVLMVASCVAGMVGCIGRRDRSHEFPGLYWASAAMLKSAHPQLHRAGIRSIWLFLSNRSFVHTATEKIMYEMRFLEFPASGDVVDNGNFEESPLKNFIGVEPLIRDAWVEDETTESLVVGCICTIAPRRGLGIGWLQSDESYRGELACVRVAPWLWQKLRSHALLHSDGENMGISEVASTMREVVSESSQHVASIMTAVAVGQYGGGVGEVRADVFIRDFCNALVKDTIAQDAEGAVAVAAQLENLYKRSLGRYRPCILLMVAEILERLVAVESFAPFTELIEIAMGAWKVVSATAGDEHAAAVPYALRILARVSQLSAKAADGTALPLTLPKGKKPLQDWSLDATYVALGQIMRAQQAAMMDSVTERTEHDDVEAPYEAGAAWCGKRAPRLSGRRSLQVMRTLKIDKKHRQADIDESPLNASASPAISPASTLESALPGPSTGVPHTEDNTSRRSGVHGEDAHEAAKADVSSDRDRLSSDESIPVAPVLDPVADTSRPVIQEPPPIYQEPLPVQVPRGPPRPVFTTQTAAVVDTPSGAESGVLDSSALQQAPAAQTPPSTLQQTPASAFHTPESSVSTPVAMFSAQGEPQSGSCAGEDVASDRPSSSLSSSSGSTVYTSDPDAPFETDSEEEAAATAETGASTAASGAVDSLQPTPALSRASTRSLVSMQSGAESQRVASSQFEFVSSPPPATSDLPPAVSVLIAQPSPAPEAAHTPPPAAIPVPSEGSGCPTPPPHTTPMPNTSTVPSEGTCAPQETLSDPPLSVDHSNIPASGPVSATNVVSHTNDNALETPPKPNGARRPSVRDRAPAGLASMLGGMAGPGGMPGMTPLRPRRISNPSEATATEPPAEEPLPLDHVTKTRARRPSRRPSRFHRGGTPA
eukprot:Rmarinus@m.5707